MKNPPVAEELSASEKLAQAFLSSSMPPPPLFGVRERSWHIRKGLWWSGTLLCLIFHWCKVPEELYANCISLSCPYAYILE